MARADEFLTDEERTRLLDAARTWRDPSAEEGPRTWMPELDLVRCLQLILLTGVQPGVLADPLGHRLRIEIIDEEPYFRYARTKKRGAVADTSFPLLEEQLVWIAPTVQSLIRHPYTVRHWHRVVSEIGRAAGIHGVAYYSLRHTAIELDSRRGSDVAQICKRFNISWATAQTYLKGPSVDRDREFRERLRSELRGKSP